MIVQYPRGRIARHGHHNTGVPLSKPMTDIVQALQNGTTSLWLFVPTAILLGGLHGLEPGHSKTMMAAFIIAIRGTIAQAMLLGVCAALSHSLVIWVLASLALHFGSQWNAENVEPYLQLGSAVMILGLAVWMFLRTRRELHQAHHHHHHHHDAGPIVLDTGKESLELTIFEENKTFRLQGHGILPPVDCIALETERADGTCQLFTFAANREGGFLESLQMIPEPHEFKVALTVATEGETRTARGEIREEEDYQDAHELEHAEDIRKRFAGRCVTTTQIALFGVTGGLMPCPAAFGVLLICLQLKQVTLGAALVASFSLGLALTMVTTGALAAWSVHHAQRKFRGFGEIMRRAPYISCALLVAIASYMAFHGWRALSGQ